MKDAGRAFLDESATLLGGSFLPRLRRAVEALEPADLWWRPNDASNAAGHLLLHLAGNLRQWIVSGVGGDPDTRDRNREFDPEERPGAERLLGDLEQAVREAVAVLDGVDPASLHERRTIQGRDVTVLAAVYHAVEHFSMHTGQILYIAKARVGHDLGFYEVRDGVPRARW